MNDLLSMLGIAEKEPPAAEPLDVTPIGATAEPPAGPATPTALDVDEWGLRRGRDLTRDNPRVAKSDVGDHAAADFFCAAFEPDPRLTGACEEPRRREFVAQLLDTPECRALRESTVLNDTAAELAATAFAEQFAELARADREREEKAKGKGAGAASPAADAAREMAAVRAVGRAVAEATKEVEELEDASGALGMGPGEPGGRTDPKELAAIFKRVKSDRGLRRICELAGRFRRVAQSKQRQKASHGYDDVVGVEPAGDLARLLPVEAAKLAVPELELDTLRRLAERQTLCREYSATEPAGKGPIIVSVDESGSMGGERVHTAKALALALAWVARRQNRWVGLVAYSGASGERLLALPPGRWDEAKLCDWLGAFIGGGSDIDVPVNEMPRMYRDIGAPDGKTDVIFLTDAVCRIPGEMQARFAAWKATARAKLVTIVVGGRDPAGSGLAAVSDECHAVPALSATESAVGRVLSV